MEKKNLDWKISVLHIIRRICAMWQITKMAPGMKED